ncbi:unnamed protein product [Rhizoctonia solani]|uniref:Uncharacterized protein n=1 Tax=Rhizoctonia solani TaxID=456999 RepID=A0A8H3GJJ2_9AGAM|nr:unnamed protein product [Rhizoctonia solani]
MSLDATLIFLQVEQEDLPARIPLIREMARISFMILEANNNVLRDPNALEPLKSIYEEFVRPEDELWIEKEVAKVGEEKLARMSFLRQ